MKFSQSIKPLVARARRRKNLYGGVFSIAFLFFLASPAFAQSDPSRERWSEIDAHLESMLKRHELDGLSLVVGWGDEVSYSRYLGKDAPETVRVAASATKLVTASVLLSLVERGVIDLDEPAAEKLPHLKEQYPDITLRQMLAHTSGMGETHGLTHPHNIPFERSVMAMSIHVPVNRPGRKVSYGGAGFATAGLLGVTSTGRAWHDLYDQYVASPLGLQDSYYTNPNAPARRAGVRNPNLSGGMMVSSRDYQKLLAALTRDHRSLLKKRTLTEMFSLQFPEADRSEMPGPIPDDGGTGLGVWCEKIRDDGSCGLVHSLGAYGALPWIDFDAEVYGILLLEGESLRELLPDLRRLQEIVHQATQ
ncbi:MAG: serine hydrolase domain-containing protein [Pseudomonadota bacterium]